MLPGWLLAQPGVPISTQNSVQYAEVFANLLQSLPWFLCTWISRFQILWRLAGMISDSLILSRIWYILVYNEHPLRQTWRFPVTKIHFADAFSEQWDETYHCCGILVRSRACWQLFANPDSVLPAKLYSVLPACSQGSHVSNLLPAHSASWHSATSEATSTPTDMLLTIRDWMLPVKRDPMWLVRSVSPPPVMSDQAPLSCSQRSQFHLYQRKHGVREIGVSMSMRRNQACRSLK
jgi:hypothetical protein